MEELLVGLLGTPQAAAPPDFRRLVAAGFQEVEGHVFFRELIDKSVGDQALGKARTGYECFVGQRHPEVTSCSRHLLHARTLTGGRSTRESLTQPGDGWWGSQKPFPGEEDRGDRGGDPGALQVTGAEADHTALYAASPL